MNSPNCPFYGRHMYLSGMPGDPPFVLIAQHGNQCGLQTRAYAPCLMEIDREDIEWKNCPRITDIRIGERQDGE